MATIYKLIIEDDEGKTTVYPLSQGEISIGRKEGNTIRLMERNVSRRHARLLRNNGSVFVEDLDSYNGIRINGERINGRYEVKEGDLVEIGDYHLALQAAEVDDEIPAGAKSDSTTQRPEWPSVGTVPDFRLPEEILAGIRKEAVHQQQRMVAAQSSARDTIVDTPVPPPLHSPAVMGVGPSKTPPIQFATQAQAEGAPRVDQASLHTLPPFPGPGGAPAPAGAFRKEAATELETRPTQLKPAPGRKDPDNLETSPIAVGPQKVAPVPRLVCVSTNYAGKEFALTRPELIIGRVEDNDIVIEHRSVSRNHAKIVFDGRVHKIIDLQSANGILVNGEEYAMTDLRKGDLIELGHVKFRFVPTGEPFHPSDEETREMREAGVSPAPEPPRATDQTHQLSPISLAATPQVPPKSQSSSASKTVEVPEMAHSFDPSTAATVTDTPLSALALNQSLTPSIEPAVSSQPSGPPSLPSALKRQNDDSQDDGRKSKPTPAAREERPTPRDVQERNVRSDTTAPRGQAGSDRPTEVNLPPVQRSNGAANPLGSSPPPPKNVAEPLTRPKVTQIDPPLRAKPTRSPAILLAGGLVIVAIVVALVMMLRGPSPSPNENDETNDIALEGLVNGSNYQKAVEFYKTKTFKDPEKARQLYQKATDALSKPDKPKPDPDPKDPGSTGPNPNPEGQLAEAPPAGDDDAPSDDAAGTKHKPSKRPSKGTTPITARTKAIPTGAEGKSGTKAKDLAERGSRALLLGDLPHAEWYLKECVALAALPECYRNLGVLYGHLSDTEKSVANYRQYLKLRPEAPDAAKIKEWIDDPALVKKNK